MCAFRALLALLETSAANEMLQGGRAPERTKGVPSDMQSILLGEGALEACADVLRWAPEEHIKATAAILVANLADVCTGPARERVVLALKQPLMILKVNFLCGALIAAVVTQEGDRHTALNGNTYRLANKV